MKRIFTYKKFCINEDYVFIERGDEYKIKLKKLNPPFNIDDEVYIIKNALDLHLNHIKYQEVDDTIRFIQHNIGGFFIIDSIAYDDENHIWFVNIDNQWLYSGSVRKKEPTYEPKPHNKRIL